MKKASIYKVACILLIVLCSLPLTGCSTSASKWYEPKEVNYLGLSRKDALTSLNLPEKDDKGSNYTYFINLKNPIHIGSYDYTTTLLFDQGKEENPLYRIDYSYETDISSGENCFQEIKKLAETLTNQFGEPDTDITQVYSSTPYLSTISSYDDYVKNDKNDGCFDLWLLDPREKGISCILYFGKDEKKATIGISFEKYSW